MEQKLGAGQIEEVIKQVYVMPCNEHFSSGILEENIRKGDMIMSEFQNDKSRNLLSHHNLWIEFDHIYFDGVHTPDKNVWTLTR